MMSPKAAELKEFFADFIFSSSPTESIYLIPAKTIKSKAINPTTERRYSVITITASDKFEIVPSTGLHGIPILGPQIACA